VVIKGKFVIALFVGAAFVVSSMPRTAVADVGPFCTPGTGLGDCKTARGVAVDDSLLEAASGHVYVVDQGSNRVNIFKSEGSFVGSFGEGQLSSPIWIAVDNEPSSASRHAIYVTTNSGDFLVKKYVPVGAGGTYVEAESFGKAGTGVCEFAPNSPIAVGPGGEIFVADTHKTGPSNSVNRVIAFDSSGACSGEVTLFEGSNSIRNFTVDSSGNYYVTVIGAGEELQKYGPTGSFLYELPKGVPGIETEGLAATTSGHIFAKQRGENVFHTELVNFFSEYGSSGELIGRFGYLQGGISGSPSLAAYSSVDGDLYISKINQGVTYIKRPPTGPVVFPAACQVTEAGLGSIKAGLRAEINPEGKPTTFRFEYLTQQKFNEEGGFTGFAETSSASLGAGVSDFNLHDAPLTAEGLTPETEYRCRVVAENADSISATIGPEGVFETEEGFKFGAASTSNVKETTATVNVEGNPLGLAATGEIEYVDDARFQASGFAEALTAPPGEIDFGAGETMQLRSVVLSGLAPGTVYHWRLRAKNGSPPEGIVCPRQEPSPCPENEHAFRTYRPEVLNVDGRRYELVSPPFKNSAEVAVPGNAAGFVEDRTVRVQAGSTSGETVTYTSFTSFAEAGGAPATSQYISKRTSDGWAIENVSPFGFQALPVVPPFSGFSADLRFGAIRASEPALAPGCQEDFANLYLLDDQSGSLHCLTVQAPEAKTAGPGLCFTYAGASQDGSAAFFSAPTAYAGAPKGEGVQLYEWREGKLQLVSVLPNGEPAPPSSKTSFGPGGGNCQWGQKNMRHVISADGSRALWTYVPSGEPSRLLVRVNGTETVQLDAKPSKNPGSGEPGNGVFWTASSDGSVVYFTDSNRLISGSRSEPGEPDLYRYEFENPSPLTNLTKGLVAGDIKGVVGASDDGSYVYFVAGAVLSGEEKNSAGLVAQAGKNNLYLFHEGKTTFIATLAPDDPDDAADWSEQPKSLSARVTPDGRHLAFLSREAKALASYDNTVAQGSHCRYEPFFKTLVGSPLCLQAFLFDADDESLTCVSCNPSGARPSGPTLLPGWTNVYEGPRFLSDNGNRFFFETYDTLLQGDVNLRRDIYEFEQSGEGVCDSGNPNFDPGAGGCHFLISNGRDTDETFLVDASADGRDVFFSTRSRLVGWDANENYDMYDYRVEGGFPEPTVVTPCAGRACLPPAPAAPAPAAPATSTFSGPPNAKPKPPKHKKRRHGKKAKQKKRNAHKRGARK